jgi:CheY-like chemotaxis protein
MSQLQSLIIDDDIKNVNVLVRLLTKEGISSRQITDPTTLDISSNSAGDIHVVFLDLEMPGLDGYQVLKKLKADARFQNVPVIAYTVHVSEINAAHHAGFDGFLGKPLDSEKFSDQLARILKGEAVWEAV